ncbi:MAG: hypothetical protein AB8G99_16885, partial [Planctomycetaceae bacterium]
RGLAEGFVGIGNPWISLSKRSAFRLDAESDGKYHLQPVDVWQYVFVECCCESLPKLPSD